MKMRYPLLMVSILSLGTNAFAGPECTKAPKSEWMSENAMKQKLADEGYVFDKFKTTSGNCYEIYGKDKDGRKVEIYFSPLDGSIIKEKRA